MTLATSLAWAVATAQTLAAAPFLTELLLGLPPARRAALPPAGTPETVILMPAHNEAATIGAILEALQLPATIRLLVVADNCSDDTAAIARAHGAEVIERHDPARRGKGYALAFGRDHLAASPPAAVIVLDADCRIDRASLARLATQAVARNAPVQSLYLLTPRADAPPMIQISSFAFLVKNRLRQRGLARLGAPVALGGTGMAFPWGLFARADLANGNLVEDLALGIELAEAGHPARFDEAAKTWSDPATLAATVGQRARWEGGFLQTARTHGLPMIARGLTRGRPGLVWLGLHVATPPLALLVMAELAAFLATLLLIPLGATHAPATLSVAILALLGLAILAAWALYGRRWLKAGTLLRLPLYLAWKLPLYARLLTGRGPRGWVRTDRGG